MVSPRRLQIRAVVLSLTLVFLAIAFSAYFRILFVLHALCAVFVIGCVIGVFALTVVAVALPFLITRKLARWLLRERWKTRYVRLSFDVAVVGLYLLIWATGFTNGMDSPQVFLDADEKFGWSRWPKSFEDSANKLLTLTMLSWFLDYFPVFVILPGGLVFFAGYSSERATQAKKSADG
jgi:hypothetical protein